MATTALITSTEKIMLDYVIANTTCLTAADCLQVLRERERELNMTKVKFRGGCFAQHCTCKQGFVSEFCDLPGENFGNMLTFDIILFVMSLFATLYGLAMVNRFRKQTTRRTDHTVTLVSNLFGLILTLWYTMSLFIIYGNGTSVALGNFEVGTELVVRISSIVASVSTTWSWLESLNRTGALRGKFAPFVLKSIPFTIFVNTVIAACAIFSSATGVRVGVIFITSLTTMFIILVTLLGLWHIRKIRQKLWALGSGEVTSVDRTSFLLNRINSLLLITLVSYTLFVISISLSVSLNTPFSLGPTILNVAKVANLRFIDPRFCTILPLMWKTSASQKSTVAASFATKGTKSKLVESSMVGTLTS